MSLGAGSELNKTIAKIPPKVLFPMITASEDVNVENSYNYLNEQLTAIKLGNTIPPLMYSNLKGLVSTQYNITQPEPLALKCATLAKGYYLKVVLSIGNGFSDRGTFELYEPGTLALIAKSEVKKTLSFSEDASAKALIKAGTEKLLAEVKKVKPELILQ
jgi:hypothetical protein